MGKTGAEQRIEARMAFDAVDYREHAIKHGSRAEAAAYVEATFDGRTLFGVGIDANIVAASLKAVCSAANRAGRGG